MIIILNAISLILLILNTFFLKNTYIGVIVLILWLLITGYSYRELLNKYFKNLTFSYLLGIFISFYLLCFYGSIFIVLYKITPIFFITSLILTTLLPLFFIKIKTETLKYSNIKKLLNVSIFPYFNINFSVLVFGFFSFSLLILFYLFQARSGDYNIYQFSKTFPLLWLLFVALISFVLIYIFKFKSEENSKNSTLLIPSRSFSYFTLSLLLIIFTSFIFHSTLPVLYKSGFGGDRLRHAGIEKSLQQGNIITPSLFGTKENVTMKNIGGLVIPEVLVVGNKQSYGNKWASDIFISWIINKDVLFVDKYFVFIFWSIFVPIFFINIFKNFTNKENLILLFSLSSLLLSPLLIEGSQGDPRGFGLLLFLFIITLFFNKIKNNDFSLKSFLLFFTFCFLLLYFNYIVFLIIFIIFVSFYILFNKINTKFKFLFIPILSLPILILDIVSAQSFLIKQSLLDFFQKIGIFFSNLFSLSNYSSNIYESSRNFIYFKTIFDTDKLNVPWIVSFAPLFSIIFILIVIIGIIYFYKKQDKYRFVVFSFLSLFLSYLISFLCFSGVRIFAKRIEIFISILLLLFFAYGILFLIEKVEEKSLNFSTSKYYNILIISIVLFYSLFSVSTLFSGPIMQNATENDFKAAKWLFSQIKNDKKFCIIGNTWPLLAMEYESGGRIVTGGFPQGLEFSQKERVDVFNSMIKTPSKDVLEKAKEITGASKCFLLLKDDYIRSAYWDKINFIEIHQKYVNLLKIFKSNKDIGDVKIFMER